MCKPHLIYEVERRGLFAFFIPSIFTPLHDTRMAHKDGVRETRHMTRLQWQLMMKCWKMSLRPGLQSWWGPTAWRFGALLLWLFKLRKANGQACRIFSYITGTLLLYLGSAEPTQPPSRRQTSRQAN